MLLATQSLDTAEHFKFPSLPRFWVAARISVEQKRKPLLGNSLFNKGFKFDAILSDYVGCHTIKTQAVTKIHA